jgi:CBS domain-containing protein
VTSAGAPAPQTVGRWMESPPATVEPDAHLAAVTWLFHRFGVSALVVTREDTHEPVAVITAAAIARALAEGRDLERTRVRTVVGRTTLTVDVRTAATDAARLMLSAGVCCVPVLDGTRLVGTVDLADLSRALPGIRLVLAAPSAP